MVLVIVAVAVAYICLMKPAKPEMRTYRIGEQGLAHDQSAQLDRLGQIVVAEIDGHEVTAKEIEMALSKLPPFQRYYYSSPEKIVIFLQNYALMQLLSAEAEQRGLRNDLYVRLVLEEKLAQNYRQVYLSEHVKPSDIVEEEIDEYMSVHAEELAAAEGMADRATAAKAAILAERREGAWKQHLEELAR